MKLEGSSFIHITNVTILDSYKAVKGLVQTVTNSNNFRVLAQQSQGACNAASILPAYRTCTYPYTVEHLERLASLGLSKLPYLWEEVQDAQGAHP
jgi:hypothetical protein